MKNAIKLLSVLFISILFNTTAKAQVSFDLDRTVDFTTYKTYSFEGWQENSDRLLTNIDKKRIQESFKSEFTIRDMDYVLGNADVIVSLVLVIDEGYKPKGTLVAEMYDVAGDKLVWRGVLRKKIKEDSTKRDTTIPKLVSKIMKNYPVEPSK